MTISAGIDIGTGSIKAVVFDSEGDRHRWLGKRLERVRRRDPLVLAREVYDGLLSDTGVAARDVAYVATTGSGENVPFRTGHFYSMTTHARGGVFLNPATRAVVDVGALNGKAIKIDARGKVLSYKMTSQCASGSGQFLENIARYLGVAVEEIGPLSASAADPEKVSSICAVLAETDVINMVSRGISTPDILKGIHLSMADRLVKLIKSTKVDEGVALITGGLANDIGLLKAIRQQMAEQKVKVEVESHPDSIHAGAIGAAIWGAFRHEKLKVIGALPAAS
jgi:benzoyl-CoA reductase subunit D